MRRHDSRDCRFRITRQLVCEVIDLQLAETRDEAKHAKEDKKGTGDTSPCLGSTLWRRSYVDIGRCHLGENVWIPREGPFECGGIVGERQGEIVEPVGTRRGTVEGEGVGECAANGVWGRDDGCEGSEGRAWGLVR
jgi:hypothetical protein